VEKLGVLISREVAGLIAEGCVVFEIWNLLEIIIEKNLVGNLNSYNLVEKLAEKNQTELVCLCARKISNLRASEIYAVLKFFLSPLKDSYDGMVKIRREWEKEAFLTIEKVKEKGLPKKALNLAREASILLMMAHDGFYSSEICLHYVFGSENFDGLVLSLAISRLDGFEVMGLMRYFMKWLEKYERFPQARPCPSARAVLGLSNCESIPTFEAVLKGLKVVLDEHFSYLVLNTEFRDELRKLESVVGSLVAEADLCCPVEDIVKHLKEVRKHEGLQA